MVIKNFIYNHFFDIIRLNCNSHCMKTQKFLLYSKKIFLEKLNGMQLTTNALLYRAN